MDTILKVENLCVSFEGTNGEVRALSGLSFDLLCGETLALVGPSGSGKTACARAIVGLLPAGGRITGGSIFFGGRDIARLSDREMCDVRGTQIGMVFQDPFSALNPLVTVGQQIAEAARRVCGRRQARKMAVELLREVGIDGAHERFYRYPFELSGGMRQRVVLAIALAMNPRVLICDEPTTALDVRVQARVLDLLREVQARRGLSLLYITHDLSVVANIADRVAVISRGKLAEIGSRAQILTSPTSPEGQKLLIETQKLYKGEK